MPFVIIARQRRVRLCVQTEHGSSTQTSNNPSSFLPPANEVWGMVMFLHLCVILFTGGVSVQGVSVQGGSVYGGFCPLVSVWGSLSEGSLSGRLPGQTPPYGNERAVRILLECILVF